MYIENKFYIWGTGNDAAKLAKRHPAVIFKCECFIDSDVKKQGEKFFFKKVITPESIDYTDKNIMIIIATSIYFEEITAYLQEHRFYNYIRFDSNDLLHTLSAAFWREIEDKEREFNGLLVKFKNISDQFSYNILSYLIDNICHQDDSADSCGTACYYVDTNIYELLILSNADYDEVKVWGGGVLLCVRNDNGEGILRHLVIEDALKKIQNKAIITIQLLRAGTIQKQVICTCYKRESVTEELWESFELTCSSSLLFDKNDEIAILADDNLEKKKRKFDGLYQIVDISCTSKVVVCDYDWQDKMMLLIKSGKKALPYWFYFIDSTGGIDFSKMCKVSETVGTSVSDMLRTVRANCGKREILVFYGNCQITTYHSLLITSERLLNKYIVVNMVAVQAIGKYKIHLTEEFFHEIDLFVYQCVGESNKYTKELATDTLVGYLRKDAKKVCIPNAYFTGYFPQLYDDLYNVVQPDICGKAFSAGDRNIRRMTDKGMTAEEISAVLKREDYYSLEEVEQNVEKTLESLKEREKKCDVEISDFIKEWYQKRQLFYTENHPSCFLLNEILKRAFLCFGEIYDFKVERGLENKRYELFIYPSVAKALNLPFAKEKYCYNKLIDKNPSDMEQYVKAYQKYCRMS